MSPTISLRDPRKRRHEMLLAELESRPIDWAGLRKILDESGEVVEEPYGILRVTRKGQSLVLRSPANGAVLPAAQLARIRHFIERTKSAPPRVARAGDWLVVLDRCDASVFRTVNAGAVPQLIRSPSPNGVSAAWPRATSPVNGSDTSLPPGFFEPLAGVLQCAHRILIIGRERRLGGEAERFIGWLRGSRPAVAQRIVASLAVEPHEFTEAGLVAKARDFYAELDGRCTGDMPTTG